MEIILTINSSYFNAGIVLDERAVCVAAAPIVKYMIGWSLTKVEDYCNRKNFQIIRSDKNATT